MPCIVVAVPGDEGRGTDALVLIDGAQAVPQFEVDLAAIGAELARRRSWQAMAARVRRGRDPKR